MGIEFLDGEINDEQVIVPRSMRAPELSMLQDGECSYVAETCLWMGGDGKLWIDRLATSLKDMLPNLESDFVRVVKLPEGFVVDISKVANNFRVDETGEFSFAAQDAPETVADGFAFDKAPVVGFLVSDGEVELFRELVRDKYGYDYPIAVPAPDN